MYFSEQQQRIYDQLRNWISSGTYSAGTSLPKEIDLSAYFKTTRTTLRPCLKQLEEENLIVRIKRKGTFVSQKALDFKKYKNIGLLMPALGTELTLGQSPTNYQIFSGIQTFCQEKSWDIHIISRRGENFSFDGISRANITGYIIILPDASSYELISKFKQHQFPFICINLHSKEFNKNINYINLDCYNAARDAVKYLAAANRKKIGFISTCSMKDDAHPFHVFEGYRHAINELNLKANAIIPDRASGKLPQDKINLFLRINLPAIRECDALIITNPKEAIEIYDILSSEKIKIPDTVSLISFFENEKTLKAGITSYSPDLHDIGYKSTSVLKDIIDCGSNEIKQIMIKPQLIIRSST